MVCMIAGVSASAGQTMSETTDLPTAPVAAAGDRAFFGHPKGLGYLLGAEAGWGFAYYGLQVTLTLYMTQTLMKPGHVEHVLGFAAYRAVVGHLTGAWTDTALASQTFGIATGLIYALPILGGLIADRWTGQRRAAIAGVLVLTLAHLLLIGEATFLIALALEAIGTGLLKTALVGQIGRLYGPNDDRRTRGFGLYLIALNTGSFLTPLIAGTIGERFGWRFGFMAMAVGMGLGAICYVLGVRYTPKDTVRRSPGGARTVRPKLHAGDLRIVVALLVLIVVDGLWQGVYNQAFNIFPVWADTHVERHIAGFLTPVTWFSTLDGVFTIAGTALAVRIWAWQAKRARDATDIQRIAFGLALAGGAYLVLAFGATIGGAGKAPLWPEVVFFLLIDFSIPWIDTVIMTMISRDSPAAITSTMLGVYYLATAFGNFLNGWLGGFADRMSYPAFWMMHAAIYGVMLALFLATGGGLIRMLAARQGGARPRLEAARGVKRRSPQVE
jgi:proton-dependent oligopeptide transporter, POT family